MNTYFILPQFKANALWNNRQSALELNADVLLNPDANFTSEAVSHFRVPAN